MSYIDHISAGDIASSGPSSGTRTFTSWNWISLSIVGLLWALFIVAALASPETLTNIWEWALDLPMTGTIVVWVLGLPWMLGLAIMHAGWPDLAQWAGLAGLVIISIATFYPTRR